MLRVMNSFDHAGGGKAAGPRWLAVAPADRAAGRRGPRGILAAITALAALLVLGARGAMGRERPEAAVATLNTCWMARPGQATPCSPWPGHWCWHRSCCGPRAAPGRWRSGWRSCRSHRAGVIVYIERRTAGRVTLEAARAARSETTEAAVRNMLGQTAGHGSMQLGGLRAECAVYVRADKDRFGEHPTYLFCFRDGMVVGRNPGSGGAGEHRGREPRARPACVAAPRIVSFPAWPAAWPTGSTPRRCSCEWCSRSCSPSTPSRGPTPGPRSCCRRGDTIGPGGTTSSAWGGWACCSWHRNSGPTTWTSTS